jgi:hypothetical protein
MTRAERRRRRERIIRWRWRLRYSQEGYDWQADTASPYYGWDLEFTQPGRWAKYNGTHTCYCCRWWSEGKSMREQAHTEDFSDYDRLVVKYNRTTRRYMPGRFKRGNWRGTRI